MDCQIVVLLFRILALCFVDQSLWGKSSWNFRFTACHCTRKIIWFCTLYNNGEFYTNKLLLDCLFFSPLPPPAKKIKLADSNAKKCNVPHVLQGELARLCSRFQVKPGISTGVVQSNTLLQCSISKLYSGLTDPSLRQLMSLWALSEAQDPQTQKLP